MLRSLTTHTATWRFEGAAESNRDTAAWFLLGSFAARLFTRGSRSRRSGRGRRCRCGRCGRGRRGSRLRLRGRIDPAGLNAPLKGFGHLGIDCRAEPHHAAERGLDVTAGATESLVKIKMAERGIKVVAPHQADHAPAEPDTFRVSCRAVDRLRSFHELVGLALAVLGCVAGSLLGGCVLRPEVAALSDGGPDPDKQSKGRNGDSLKNGNSKPGTNPTHEIPDEWRASRQRSAPNRCPAIAAEDCLYRNCLIPMKDIYVFVQQGGSLMRFW